MYLCLYQEKELIMNNLPENDNKMNEEFSTIFSNPTEHTKTKVTKGKKRRLKSLIACIMAIVVLLGGTFAVVKLIPERVESGKTQDEITVLDYNIEDINQVTVKNANGNFKIYSEKVETKTTEMDENGKEQEVTKTETLWYVVGYDKDLISTSYTQQVVNMAISVTASREITTKTTAECGLDSPLVSVDITTKQETKTLLIGNKSPDNMGIYVKLSDRDKIYLVSDALDESLGFNQFEFASTEAVAGLSLDSKYKDYYVGEDLAHFDTLTLSGKNFPQDMVFIQNDNEDLASYSPYLVTKPLKRNSENVDILFSFFTKGFPVSGAYSYDVSKDTINSLGLNDPDLVISAKFGDLVYSYKFKKQNDGDYAVVGTDSKNVKKITASEFAFLNYETNDYYSKIVFLTPIDELSNLTIKTNDQTYSFDIKENSGSELEQFTIKYNDTKAINSSNFQTYYQYLCSLSCIDFETQSISSSPELSIIFTYVDNEIPSSRIDFVKADAVKYQYSIDNVNMGKISSSSFKKIISNLEKTLEGKKVIVN